MDVAFRGLVPGRFLTRPNRFVAEVEIGRRRAFAHVPNAGRLRELFAPGVEVRLASHGGERRTAYDLVLVRIPPEERGPGEGEWACVDSRLPPRVLAAAMARCAVPGLEGGRVVRTEPRLGAGRADLLVAGPGWEALVETKSVTLVRAGAGLFPDSPSVRGARHASDLALERGRRRLVVFVIQRPDCRAVRVNEPADPAFATAVRRAERRGVELLAGVCEVGPEGIAWREALPIERYRPDAPATDLPDQVRPGLRLLVCGSSPDRYSAWYGMRFAHPRDRFWPAMRAAGLVPASSGPGEEAWLCRELGIGFTHLVGPAEASRPAAWAEGAERVRSLVRAIRPQAVCLVGLRGARAVFGPDARPGPQPPLEGVPCFAVPATDGRGPARPRELAGWFRALADWLAAA